MCGRARQSLAAVDEGYTTTLGFLPPDTVSFPLPPPDDSNDGPPFSPDNLHPGHPMATFSLNESTLTPTTSYWGIIKSGTKHSPLPGGTSKHFAEQSYNSE